MATSKKAYRDSFRSDTQLRQYLTKRLRGMYVDVVEIERSEKQIRVNIKTSRPGMIIGRSGEGATKLQKDIEVVVRKSNKADTRKGKIDIEESRSPESRASIGADMVP